MEGAGEKAELLLSNYADRLARGLVTRIAEVKRTLPAGTQTHTTVKVEPFSPRPRFRRKKSSSDRYGAFAKGTGFEGWKKGLFEQAWFDSKPERAMANILDDAEEIDVWIRLHNDELPILWQEAERTYNPDLLAIDKQGEYWIVETKADKDLPTDEVQEKRKAALTWANAVNAETDQTWHYLLVAERDLGAAKGSWPHIVKATGV
jgi:type III restriction enzyme